MEKNYSYFTEETMRHLIFKSATKDRWLLRALKAMIACKLTLVYGPYHQMRDLQSLAASGFQDTYEEPVVKRHSSFLIRSITLEFTK